MNDMLTKDLGQCFRKNKHYGLYRAPWQTIGLSLWANYTEGTEKRSYLVSDDLPESAIEDFDTYVDYAEEEVRCMAAEFRLDRTQL